MHLLLKPCWESHPLVWPGHRRTQPDAGSVSQTTLFKLIIRNCDVRVNSLFDYCLRQHPGTSASSQLFINYYYLLYLLLLYYCLAVIVSLHDEVSTFMPIVHLWTPQKIEDLKGHREMCWFTLCWFRSVNLPENRAGIRKGSHPAALGSWPYTRLPTSWLIWTAQSQKHTGHPARHRQGSDVSCFHSRETNANRMERSEKTSQLILNHALTDNECNEFRWGKHTTCTNTKETKRAGRGVKGGEMA